MPMSPPANPAWPELPYLAWKDTCATLQLWVQIVGKIRLARTPWLNHSWHVPLYVTTRGLTTSPIPYDGRSFSIDFDFIEHALIISESGGAERRVALRPRTVADFYAAVMAALSELGLPVAIHPVPNEIADGIKFSDDSVHRAYDPGYAERFWRALVQVERVFSQFRTRFLGKCSPVHFFWGSFDLAVTRFSGRPAPLHRGVVPALPRAVLQEAYSHEVSSAGFWPGGGAIDYAAFYSYAYPEPQGFRAARVKPSAAFYDKTLGEFLLPYDAVRTAADPDADLLAFLQTTYQAAADNAKWDRNSLDCEPGKPRVPRRIR
jgi:hypothetical protein